MKRAVFTIEGGKAYIGYTDGYLWNGWATPYFTLAEAKKIQAEWKGLTYDENTDEFRIQYEEYDEPYIWKGEDCHTVDGKLHLYGIGAYSHVWDRLGDENKRFLAEQITEFIYDFDTYECMDIFEHEYEAQQSILAELDSIDTFATVYNIWNSHLTSDEIYNKLAEVLHI